MTPNEAMAAFATAWNTDDDEERGQLLTASCNPDAVFVSPQGQTNGIGAQSASIGEFRRAFPAAVVSFGAVDEHGGFARVAWTTTWINGQPPLTGEDFVQLGADGRIDLLVSLRRHVPSDLEIGARERPSRLRARVSPPVVTVASLMQVVARRTRHPPEAGTIPLNLRSFRGWRGPQCGTDDGWSRELADSYWRAPLRMSRRAR
jgi:hypothetical protein